MYKVRGVGLDLCGIARMDTLLADERFLTRYFTAEEAAYIRSRGKMAAQSMAGIYAAKEAALKALGVGLAVPLTDVEIVHSPAGQPCYCFHGRAAALVDGGSVALSITHEQGMAAAVAVWSGEDGAGA